jgi:hypothetical protein
MVKLTSAYFGFATPRAHSVNEHIDAAQLRVRQQIQLGRAVRWPADEVRE